MEDSIQQAIGNPITLLIERIAYLGIGLFFALSLITGLLRQRDDEKSD